MKSIVAGLWMFTYPIGINTYVIEDPDGLTVVDTGIAPTGPAMIKALGKLGHAPTAIKRILITHAHPDHYGSLPYLQKTSGAHVITSQPEQQVLEKKSSVARRPSGFSPPDTWVSEAVTVDRVIADGDTLPDIMGGLHVIGTPGHAPGHLSFWHPTKRVLIAGDVLFHLFGLGLPPGFLTADMDENCRSVRKVAALEPHIVTFGHGGALTQNTAAELKAFAQKKGL